MRADRLLAILMLLQTRGRMTAQVLAETLEVSERTIYRDIEALSIAGVPIVGERGPGGGCSLIEHYRTQLTGLNENELRALFLLSVPAPLADLGVHTDLRNALLKLSAALPPLHRDSAAHWQQRIHLDWSWWFAHAAPPPFLSTLHAAAQMDRCVRMVYQTPFAGQIETLCAPYGLVSKAGAWYVVLGYPDHVDAMKVSGVLEAHLTDAPFHRPPTFDLAEFWVNWCQRIEAERPRFLVRARIAPTLTALLGWHFGDALGEILKTASAPDEAGWRGVTLPFESFETARERILGYGSAIEVLEPISLRLSVLDFARQIVAHYGSALGNESPLASSR